VKKITLRFLVADKEKMQKNENLAFQVIDVALFPLYIIE